MVTKWSRKSAQGRIRQHYMIAKVLLSGSLWQPLTHPERAKNRLVVEAPSIPR
jgi:hypothetical protein